MKAIEACRLLAKAYEGNSETHKIMEPLLPEIFNSIKNQASRGFSYIDISIPLGCNTSIVESIFNKLGYRTISTACYMRISW